MPFLQIQIKNVLIDAIGIGRAWFAEGNRAKRARLGRAERYRL
jgi:hypothetical protein